ncbi:MAG: hemerythrin domain-containing protein, partial [Blastocatellia bacterium]|nr:hemerythrin domain-containing protein [Blastocatellia bacterium]
MSFAELLNIHERLDELFLLHQESLLRLDLEMAAERLRIYDRELRAHIQVEEDLLMPVYERAGKIAGGPPEFFTGEHRRMLEFLARFAAALDELKGASGDPARGAIRLFDEEAAFKSLCEHHDMREGAIFFPALDRVTDKTERRDLIDRCFTANSQ